MTRTSPSGSGKTTLLRIIAGLEFPTSGQVLFDDEDASRRHVGARGVGFVFQHYALFRHMTVFENVAFGMRVKPRRERPSGGEIRKRVMELLELVQLKGFAQRYPSQLSGGQRQRVALARALELADDVVVMRGGGIEQVGAPAEIYDPPATPFVYEFLGEVNRLPVTVARGRARLWDQDYPTDSGKVEVLGRGLAYIRPEDIELVGRREPGTTPARVAHLTLLGPIARAELEVQGQAERIGVQLSRGRAAELQVRPGAEVFMRARQVRVFRVGEA